LSTVQATLLAALIGGGLALLGVFIERFSRSIGLLWCESTGWDLTFDDQAAKYSVCLDLFNGKEIPVGLRSISVVFICKEGKLISEPEEVQARPFPLSPIVKLQDVGPLISAVSVVNLPPRQWMSKELQGRVYEKEDVRLLAGWRKVEFVGQRQRRGLFERKTYRKVIAVRPPLPDPWQREHP